MPIQKHPVLMIVDLMFASLFGLGNPSVLYLHEIVTFYWTFSACDTKDVGTPIGPLHVCLAYVLPVKEKSM